MRETSYQIYQFQLQMDKYKQFCRSMLEELNKPYEYDPEKYFIREAGLCTNLKRYNAKQSDAVCYLATQNYLFLSAGLSVFYPFNADEKEYLKESQENSFYNNPARMQWLIDHAK